MANRLVFPRWRHRWWVAALAVVALVAGLRAVAPARAAVVTQVIYREIFPFSSSYGANPGPRQNALDEGWRGYWDGKTVDTTPITDNTGLQIFGSGSPNIQPAVASNPVNSGEGNAFWSPLESRVVIYTEEYSFPAADLYQITYETNHNNSDDPQQDFPLLKIDGLWYAPDCAFVHTDPDNNTGTWTTATFTVNDVTWMQLDIDPATNKATAPGTDCVGTGDFDPPLQTGLSFDSLGATVQAFGLYLPDPESINVLDLPNNVTRAPTERFDNYTLIAQYEYADVFVSTTAAGTTDDGLAFGQEDIILWDGVEWSTWFDGSDAGLTPTGNFKHDINAFWIPDPGSADVVMSFTQNARIVPGIGPAKVDGMDLVWWDGSAFTLYFDGQDVGLTNKTQEKIDAVDILDGNQAPPELIADAGSCQAYLLLSTQGPGKVPNYSGGALNFSGEDVLGFCLTGSGATTAGKWIMVLDGSAQGMPKNSTDSISLSDDGNVLYLTTKGAFNVDTATGGHSMVYGYDRVYEEFFGPLFVAADYGLSQKVDGLQVEGSLIP